MRRGRRVRRRRALSGRLFPFGSLAEDAGAAGVAGVASTRSEVFAGGFAAGRRRFDGWLDRQVLGFLAHQDRSAGHRQDDAKANRRRDPEPWLRLAGVNAWRDRALAFQILPCARARAVELARHFRRRGRLHWFVGAGRDNQRRPGGVHLVHPG